MVKKRSDTLRGVEPPEIDDLQLINGIGPAVERRLHDHGIYTFARLAGLSPADIAAAVADLAGLSAERITKQDWIGQALRLASESISSKAQEEVEAPEEPHVPIEHAQSATPSLEPQKGDAPSIAGHHIATFTVELMLDENNNVQSTHVVHVQSRREHTWADWPKAGFVEFLAQSAGLNLPLIESPAPNVVSKEAIPPVVAPLSAKEAQIGPPVGVLRLREMKTIPADAHTPHNFLLHGQPFDVHLTLDLSDVRVSRDTQCSYKAFIYGKSLEGHPRQIVGETNGVITPTDSVTIQVHGTELPKGIYRLQAQVTLQTTAIEPMPSSGITATSEGDLLLII